MPIEMIRTLLVLLDDEIFRFHVWIDLGFDSVKE